jgi:hypothetical protein
MRSKHLRHFIQQSLSPSANSFNPEQEQPMEARRETSELEDTATHAKRQRPSPTDTEDELLAAAGVPTKRFRED